MIEAHFSKIKEILLQKISDSSDIKIAVCWFTDKDLFDFLCNKLSENKTVSLIVLNDGINNSTNGLDFQTFISLGGLFYFSDTNKLVHSKYCILDNATIITGSYNWTYMAKVNFENILITDDPNIVESYSRNFNLLTKENPQINNIESFANRTPVDWEEIDKKSKKNTPANNPNPDNPKYIEIVVYLKLNPSELNKKYGLSTEFTQKTTCLFMDKRWHIKIRRTFFKIYNPENIEIFENMELYGTLISDKFGTPNLKI